MSGYFAKATFSESFFNSCSVVGFLYFMIVNKTFEAIIKRLTFLNFFGSELISSLRVKGIFPF